MPDESLGICQRIRETVDGAMPYWRPMREARTELLDFLDGDRYQNDSGPFNKDRRRHQFRGQEISNVNRNKAAQATATPRNLEALPLDTISDPEDAEIAVSVLNWELDQPWKGFDDTLDEVVQDAIDARVGCAMLDFDPDIGEFGGETFWRWKDANLVMFEPGFSDPHHMQCGWMLEAQRIPMAKLKAMGKVKGKGKWHGVEHIVGDASAVSAYPGEKSKKSTLLERAGVPGESIDDDYVWIWKCWYKNDEETYSVERESQEMPEGERYMGCDNPECGYRSKTQDQLLKTGQLGPGETLPDEMEPCPECGEHLSRRDLKAEIDEVLAYPKGQRLVIMAALQQTPDDEPFYDGPWPVPARSFPVLWVTAYAKGGRPMGDCDTDRNWDAQLASDQLLTMAFDRVMSHQTYYVMPADGYEDVDGNRYEFRDDQYNVIIKKAGVVDRPTPDIEVVQGAALDPAWVAYWQSVQTTLLGPQGTNDMGLTPDRSKNIAASTVAQLDKIGNIPIDHFNRRKNRALGKAYGVHWDYIRNTYTADKLARLQIGDETIVDRLRGDDLPNFDFIVTETPPFSGLEKARAEAGQALIQIATTQPEWLDIIADINKFPPSIVRKVKRKLEEMRQAAAQQAMQAAMGGPPVPDELMQGFTQEPGLMDMVRGGTAPESPEAPAAMQAA